MIVGAHSSSNGIKFKGLWAKNQTECSRYQNFCDNSMSALVLAYQVNALLT